MPNTLPNAHTELAAAIRALEAAAADWDRQANMAGGHPARRQYETNATILRQVAQELRQAGEQR